MGRSKFPGKPSKLVNKKRISVLAGSAKNGNCDTSADDDTDNQYSPNDQSLWSNHHDEQPPSSPIHLHTNAHSPAPSCSFHEDGDNIQVICNRLIPLLSPFFNHHHLDYFSIFSSLSHFLTFFPSNKKQKPYDAFQMPTQNNVYLFKCPSTATDPFPFPLFRLKYKYKQIYIQCNITLANTKCSPRRSKGRHTPYTKEKNAEIRCDIEMNLIRWKHAKIRKRDV